MTDWTTYPISEFDDFRDDWQRINEAWLKQPIMDADFVAALIRHFFAGDELLCVGKEEGRPISMGFFRKVRPLHWATAMPSQAPLGLWQHERGRLDPKEIRQLASVLPGAVLMIDFLQLDSEHVHPSDGGAFLRQPYIETGRLGIPADFDAYFASLSKNTRQNYRRINNKAVKAGLSIKSGRITDPAMMAEAVATYGRIESASWKATGGTAVSPDNEQGRFYADLLTSYAENGAASCWHLEIDGEIVAVDLCIANATKTVILKTTFAEAFKQFSPAMQLKFDIIRHLSEMARDDQFLEFYGKAMDWHRKLTEDCRPVEHFSWFHAPWVRRAYGFLKSPSRTS